MLVISRKSGESLKIAEEIEIVIVSIEGQRVRVGIKAPKHIKVLRTELEAPKDAAAPSPAEPQRP